MAVRRYRIEEKIEENWGGFAAPVLLNFSLFGWAGGTAAPSHRVAGVRMMRSSPKK